MKMKVNIPFKIKLFPESCIPLACSSTSHPAYSFSALNTGEPQQSNEDIIASIYNEEVCSSSEVRHDKE